MPPVRTVANGRASRACESCRKGKTSCYPQSTGVCLRCTTLGLKCSLCGNARESTAPERPAAAVHDFSAARHDCAAVEQRVNALEITVKRLADAVQLDLHADVRPRSVLNNAVQTTSLPTREAPLLVLRDAAADSQDYEPAISSGRQSIIEKGYLSAAEVRQLLDLFRSHYRRWIALRESKDTEAYLDFTGSPLLLCACCLIAVRHWDSIKGEETAAILFTEAKDLLQNQLLEAPQSLAFFQAVRILSLWSTTIGQKPLSIDSWLTSGLALQHGTASDVFKDIKYSSSLESEYTSTVGRLLLWSRICLAHLHACVSMRRKAVFGASEIDRIKKTLPPGELSNFEMRMVAELSLYWDLYENAVAAPVALPQAQAALQGWKLVWQFLFDQPRSQFLKMGFHFAQLLIFEQSLNNKSAAVRESLISEMVRLSSAILQLAMETADDRTKHLTDHIYHMISFAAVTLCRLLCKYDDQVQPSQDATDHDLLIMNTASWLRALGTQLHVGQTMGNLIDAVHRKLRPSAHRAHRRDSEPEHATPDQLTFPELLGVDTFDLDWDAILPDWQSLASDEIAHSSYPS